ncbi:hypothetical protein L1987_33957 [Smallanthus sonchifolius]|uniref:Uncharacterized protein n=1 Tax=Smallanthus sonchifolius TaxID=185202 RepID=A0ACB9HSI6_9ASTR|nr:hypothetical protein L1987_33957 [Smallanthus sonchifolius]
MATTDSSNERKQLHVAMFPWLGFGHIIPFLTLSKFIAQKGHTVSFLSTTRNIQRLPTLPSHLSPLINLVKLTLPRVQELPQNAEATMDVRTDDILITSRRPTTVFSRWSLGFSRKNLQTGLFTILLPTSCRPSRLALEFREPSSQLSMHGSSLLWDHRPMT